MEKDFQRWTAKRKVELLLQLIRGETKLVDVCREHDLKQSEVESWMETFMQAPSRRILARLAHAVVFAHRVTAHLRWFKAHERAAVFAAIERQLLHEPLVPAAGRRSSDLL